MLYTLPRALVPLAQDLPQIPATKPTVDAVASAVDVVFRDSDLQSGIMPRTQVGDLEAIWAYLFSAFQEWVRYVMELRVDSPAWYTLLVFVLVATLVLLVWHMAYTMRRVLRAPAPENWSRSSAVPDHRIQHSSVLRARARQLAQTGEYRDAATHLLLALLALLEERRIVHVARGWTNREILGRVAVRCGDSTELRTFGDTVERSSYGGAAINSSTFDELDAAFDTLGAQFHGTRA